LITNSYALPKDKIDLMGDIKLKFKNEAVNSLSEKHKEKLKEFLSKNPKEIKKQHEKFKQSYD